MGFDLAGLNPKNPDNIDRPTFDWDAHKSDAEKKEYSQSMAAYNMAVPGDYFRNNVWWWHRTWDFVCHLCEDFITKDEQEEGHSNSGLEIDEERANKMAIEIDKAAKSGAIKKEVELYYLHLETLEDTECDMCDGTGTRKGWEGWQTEGEWLKTHDSLIKPNLHDITDNHQFVHYEHAHECKGCNVCGGTGRQKNWACSYHISEENVLAFGKFVANSGGFVIT